MEHSAVSDQQSAISEHLGFELLSLKAES